MYQGYLRQRKEAFVEETVECVAVTFLADTSASMLVLSSQVYQAIGERQQPAFRGSGSLRSAGGAQINGVMISLC